MGEAKRRKQLDPNYGKPLKVIINPDLPLTPNLERVEKAIKEKFESPIILNATLELKEKSYPIMLVPNIKDHQRREKLYCEVVFDREFCPPNVTQKLIDSISIQASQEIIDRSIISINSNT